MPKITWTIERSIEVDRTDVAQVIINVMDGHLVPTAADYRPIKDKLAGDGITIKWDE